MTKIANLGVTQASCCNLGRPLPGGSVEVSQCWEAETFLSDSPGTTVIWTSDPRDACEKCSFMSLQLSCVGSAAWCP